MWWCISVPLLLCDSCQSDVLSILADHSVAKLSLSETSLLYKNWHTVTKIAGYFQMWLLQQKHLVFLPKNEQYFDLTFLSYCCYNRPQTLYFLVLAAHCVKSVPSVFNFTVCVCFWFWLFACLFLIHSFCLSRNSAWVPWG